MVLFGKSISRSLFLKHFFAWIVYYFVINSILFLDGHNLLLNLERTSFTYLLIAIFFYIEAHLIIDKFIPAKQYILAILSTFLLGCIYVLCRYILFFIIFAFLNVPNNYTVVNSINSFWIDSVFLFLSYLMLSVGYWYAIYSYRLEKQKRILEGEKAQIELEKQQAELSFLQAQINPHFLYNTLNTLYSQALFQAPPLAKSILALSNMMRYTVIESRKDKNFVPLQMELENIENFIHLQQTRYANTLNIDYQIDGREFVPFLQIPSLILISFIENGIKHGDLKNAQIPFVIRIKLTDNSLSFWAKNQKNFSEKEKTTGVGLTNVKNRLALLYKKDHSFTLTDEPTTFTVEMNLYNLKNHTEPV